MRSMGVRPNTSAGAHWVVVQGTTSNPVLVSSGVIATPKAFDEAQALAHLRERLTELIDEHGTDAVVIRGIEPNAKATMRFYPRLRAEGVALEAAHAAGKESTLMVWKSIASLLATRTKKDEYRSADEFRGIETAGWKDEAHDALIAAVAGLPK
ncbi:hypothetical protein RHDC4_01452 [Rhodocyclaceae bacterium]|nr:hypothetical protein RHDC4_01452 [Rhodocyclaceae bacterium]